MAPRPNWKGYLKLSLVSCSIALYPATSASERVSFNQLNKNTGNRIRYKKVDAETQEEVEADDIIKGYQVEKNVYVQVENEELEALQVEATHTIDIDKFVPLDQIDPRYYDSPYYVVPNDKVGQDAFAVIRDAMADKKMVGLGKVVISKRERPIILEPLGKGLRAMTLRYPYEVRKEDEYFADIPDVKVPAEMLKLAEHIVDTKAGDFDPSEFEDTYETAVVDMLRKKQSGKAVAKTAPKAAARGSSSNVIDLLKKSLELSQKGGKTKAPSLVPSMPKAEKESEGVMKDQITALMEAMRLVGVEIEDFKRRRQSRDETLDAIERILDDPSVTGAVAMIESFVNSPSIVPQPTEEPADA